MNKAVIANIQRFSVGDGPGIRTTVFFKGCNLRCPWCHNPETVSAEPQTLHYASRCRGCGACDGHTKPENCCYGALERCGTEYTTDSLLPKLLEDKPFYGSDGGVTLSGGEPLLRPEFCAAAAGALRENGVGVIIDTAGCVPFSAFEPLLPLAESFYIDLKLPTEEGYRELIGGSLELVLANMSALSSRGADVRARIPIIPGVNNSAEAMRAFSALLLSAGVRKASLLPFHRLGSAKYAALGLRYAFAETVPPIRAELVALARLFDSRISVEVL